MMQFQKPVASKKWAPAIAFAALWIIPVAASAHDHPPAKISGQGIDLFERNHAFSGQILETPVFGVFEHQPFGAQVQMRRGENTLTLKLQKTPDQYAGEVTETRINSQTGESETIATKVEFVKVERLGEREGLISLKIDDETVNVSVSAPAFDHGHFLSPTFEATVQGRIVRFEFTGESCFGYSANLSMMILGAYAHSMK